MSNNAPPSSSAPVGPKFAAQVDQLGSEFLMAHEWGVFRQKAGTPDELEQEITAKLAESRRAGLAGDTVAEQNALLDAKAALCEAQRRRPVWHVANTRFGLLPLGFTTLTAAIIFVTLFAAYPHPDVTHSAMFWGYVGAVLKALYWLQYQINKGALRPRWFAYSLVAPAIGVLLGAISSLIVKVGFKLFHDDGATLLDWRVMALFAAFAGFNWEWALEKFRYSADAVAARVSDRGGKSSG